MNRRRGLIALLVLVVAAVLYSGWQVLRVRGDLTDAEQSVQQLRDGITGNDPVARRDALGELRVSAAAAHAHSSGPWWSAAAHLPVVGDDVSGVRALGSSLDMVASGGIQPVADAVDDLDTLVVGGRVDLDGVAALQEPMTRAASSLRAAHAEVSRLDSSGYAGPLKTRFDDYVDQVAQLDKAVASAATVTSVLPRMLGADGPRDYLLVFQNNAEVRATGGLPGSWSRVHAEGGQLSIVQQGSGAGFAELDKPVLPLTKEEQAVYGDQLGTYFLDANFTPDFPRAADLWKARYERDNPDTPVDGVLSLDPVALSYLLRGTGPVSVGDVQLTADNAVQQLLSGVYAIPDPTAQDAFFASAASAVFDRLNSSIDSPLELLRGFVRAGDEGRFRLASYDDGVDGALGESPVKGALRDDTNSPHVEVTLNDATGSKMSYYLRYRARVRSQSCSGGRQTLQGTMSVGQNINGADAQALPDYVTGGGVYGTPVGQQTVLVRLYGPSGGDIGPIMLDGERLDVDALPLDGRPTATLIVRVDGTDDVVLNWSMTSGADQTGSGTVGATPGVEPGSKSSVFASSC